MTIIDDTQDNGVATSDEFDEFDELEALAERGTFWSPRDAEKNHPHTLVLRALRWETAASKFNPKKQRDIVVGKTKTGDTWKIACDNLDLAPLHTGEIKRWNDDERVFEVVDNWGPVRVD